MELRVLHYFVTVASAGNITRASQQLLVTQPTLSKQLKELEEELGVTLFVRGNREIRLTEDGDYFLRKAKEILALVDNTVSNLHADEELSGDLYIGGNESPQLTYLVRLFTAIHQEAPNTQLHLQAMTTDLAFEQLDKGLLDFVLSVGLVNTEKYEHLRLPWQDQGMLLIPKEHPLAQKETITGHDLEDYPIIAFGQKDAYADLANWLGTSPDRLQFVGSFSIPSVGIQMVQAGLGLAFCLDGITIPEELTLRPLEPAATPSLRLIWKKDQPLSKLGQAFLDRLLITIAKENQ